MQDIIDDPSESEERRRDASSFRWSTVVVNQDLKSSRHRDSNNAGKSAIVALGRHSGGQLRWWPGDNRTKPLTTLIVGDSVLLPVKNQLQFFDGRRAHETMKFSGKRTSIIWFACDVKQKVAKDVQETAEALHFRLPESIVRPGGPVAADGSDGDAAGPAVLAGDIEEPTRHDAVPLADSIGEASVAAASDDLRLVTRDVRVRFLVMQCVGNSM